MLRRCVSISFIFGFCFFLFTLQHLYLLGTDRQRSFRDLHSREQIVCGRNGCKNIELKPVYAKEKAETKLVEAATKRGPSFHRTKMMEEATIKSTNYIFPVMYYNMGPNNLFRILKEAISLATLFNRTLVIPPFPHHPRMEKVSNKLLYDNDEEMMEVDIFDQSYRSMVETDASKILDVQQLSKLLPLATYKDFKKSCRDTVETTLTCGKISGKRVEGLKHFNEATGVQLGKKYEINQITDDDLKTSFSLNLLNAVRSTSNQQCVAIALGHKCFGSRQAWLNFWGGKSKYYQRPVPIQNLAQSFIAETFHNKPFLAVHWRFENVDWLDMCKLSRPSSVRKINRPICDIVEQIVFNRTFIDEIAVKIENYMKEENLEYLYFAAPPQLNSALEHLQTKLGTMYYSSNVKKFAEKSEEWMKVFNDNFAASFLDQELCYRSQVFLGSPLSSWTQTVMLDRVSQGLFNHHSIFDIILDDSSEFPKLSWYFPEGL